MPRASRLTPHASRLMPHASCLGSVTRHSGRQLPGTVTRQYNSTAPNTILMDHGYDAEVTWGSG